jgi:YNFM family putative membrane transporter
MQTQHNKLQLFVACFITCMAVASVYLTQSIFPLLAQSYAMPESAGRLTFTYTSMAYAVAFFVVGPLSDLISARRLASIGLAGSALAPTVDSNCFGTLGASRASCPSAVGESSEVRAMPQWRGEPAGSIRVGLVETGEQVHRGVAFGACLLIHI